MGVSNPVRNRRILIINRIIGTQVAPFYVFNNNKVDVMEESSRNRVESYRFELKSCQYLK